MISINDVVISISCEIMCRAIVEMNNIPERHPANYSLQQSAKAANLRDVYNRSLISTSLNVGDRVLIGGEL